MNKKIITLLIGLGLVLGGLATPVPTQANSISTEDVTKLVALMRVVINADFSPNTKNVLLNLLSQKLTLALSNDSDDDENHNDTDDEDNNEDEDEDDDNDDRDTRRYPSAHTNSVIDSSQLNDDRAEFKLTFNLQSFGNDTYLDQDLETSFDFEIIDSDDNVVATDSDLGNGKLSGVLTSKYADEQDDYYVIYEDESEQFSVYVTFEPTTSDYYRLRITELDFNDQPDSPENSYKFNSRYFTSNPIYVHP